MAQVSFRITQRESKIIQAIVERALELFKAHDDGWSTKPAKVELMMDVTACHANGNPLRLEALLAAEEFDFLHDVFGIRQHIDRETGKLGDCFVPRYSVPEPCTLQPGEVDAPREDGKACACGKAHGPVAGEGR